MAVVYLGIIFVAWLLFFFPVLSGQSTMFEDVLEQNFPNFYYMTQNLKEGILPFFNHKIFSSIHFLHDPQVFNLNPTAVLRYAMGVFMNNDIHTFLIGLAIPYLLAGIFMFIYLRRRFEDEIALFGAITYMFSLGYVVVFIHNFAVDSLWILPLFMLALEKEDWRFSMIAGVLVGFMLFAGHPQIPIYTFLMGILFYLYFRRFRNLVFFLIGTVPFFAAYYLAFIDVVKDSPRLSYTLEQLLEISFYPKFFIQLLVPKFYGALEPGARFLGGPYYFYIEITQYFSLAALVFAVLGLWRGWKDSLMRFLGIVAIVALFFALGKSNPLVVLLYKTGLFSGIRNPSRAMYIVAFIVPILTSYGLSTFLREKEKLFRPIIYTVMAMVVVAVAYLVTNPGMPPMEGEMFKFFLILTVLLIVIFAFIRNTIPSTIFVYSIVAIAFVDLYLAGNSYLKWKEDLYRYYNMRLVQRFKMDKGLFRINARSSRGMVLRRNSGMITGLELTEGYNPMMPYHYAQLYQHVLERKKGFLNLLEVMNVRYYITDKGFARIRELPRAYVVYSVREITDSATFFRMAERMNFMQTAYVQMPVTSRYNSEGFDPCRVDRYDAERIVLTCNARADGFLYLSKTYQRLLRARVDGKEVPVIRTNWAFSGLELGKGSHVVEFYMDSRGLLLALLLFLVGTFAPVSMLLPIFRGRSGL